MTAERKSASSRKRVARFEDRSALTRATADYARAILQRAFGGQSIADYESWMEEIAKTASGLVVAQKREEKARALGRSLMGALMDATTWLDERPPSEWRGSYHAALESLVGEQRWEQDSTSIHAFHPKAPAEKRIPDWNELSYLINEIGRPVGGKLTRRLGDKQPMTTKELAACSLLALRLTREEAQSALAQAGANGASAAQGFDARSKKVKLALKRLREKQEQRSHASRAPSRKSV